MASKIRDPRPSARGSEEPGVAEPRIFHRSGRKRCMVRRFSPGPASSLWIALVVIRVGTAAVTRSAPVEGDSLTLDGAWFESLARAESVMCVASSRAEVDSADRFALVEQIRVGLHILGSFVLTGIASDTALARPLVTVRLREPPTGKHRILMATGVISSVASLVHLVATLSGASPQTRNVL